MEIVDILHDLTSIVGPSGYEYKVAKYMMDNMRRKCVDIHIDKLGNLICRVNEKEGKPRVLIFSHMDELGFIVRKIEKDGFLRLERLGGIPEKAMVSTRVIILNDRDEEIEGVIGIKSHHLTPLEEKYKVTTIKEIYVDVGAGSDIEVRRMGIEVGNPVVYARSFHRIRNRIFSNSIDNRGGCTILLKILEEIDPQSLNVELFLVGSVQEEFSLRGVLPAVRSVNPDLAICLDISIATDTPDLNGYMNVKLGGGPTINLYTFHGRGTLAGLIPSRNLVNKIIEIANEGNINLQRNIFFGGLTDASFAQLEMNGIPMVDLGFPARYSHSPVEECDLRDLERLKDLLLMILYKIDEDFFREIHSFSTV